jgi:hypothetical protein
MLLQGAAVVAFIKFSSAPFFDDAGWHGAERVQDLSKTVAAMRLASLCVGKIRQSTIAWTNLAAINKAVFWSRGASSKMAGDISGRIRVTEMRHAHRIIEEFERSASGR